MYYNRQPPVPPLKGVCQLLITHNFMKMHWMKNILDIWMYCVCPTLWPTHRGSMFNNNRKIQVEISRIYQTFPTKFADKCKHGLYD